MADQPFVSSLKPGMLLDKYEIREQVAAGGMAIIYKAYDPSLDRYVAIKQIAPHLAQDEKFAVRFKTEAQTLARLSSSQANIVHVHELIQQDGQLYLVMEYVEGTTLRALMDRGPVPLQTGLGVLLSTALGLRAMHAQGIVHRDLTPANIMMAKDGALKITDFGLIGHSGGRTSLPMGTTKYMAPEMFTGAPIDPRADLYSLGMIAYEMFAGPEKFGDAFKDVLRDEKAQQVRWMHWHSNVGLRAPPLKELQPGIPPLVSKIVERLMDKDPSKRFASADQIVKWLRKIFVMNVQAKSVPVAESEAIEKEMEADVAAPTVPVVRPTAAQAAAQTAARAAGAVSAAPLGEVVSPEKTAPLPKPVWTWQRMAFWAAVVVGPLILASVSVVYWKYSEEQGRVGVARTALQVAKDLFENKQFMEAYRAYMKVTQDFPDLKGDVLFALRGAQMARAEDALAKKDWATADAALGAAIAKEADSDWTNGFKTRFTKARTAEEKMNQADAAAKAGEYERAIETLKNLQDAYPDQKINELIAELRDKIDMRAFQGLMIDAKDALAKNNYPAARSKLVEAAKIRPDSSEASELLATVDRKQKAGEAWGQGLKDEAAGKWAEAVANFDTVMKLQPSEQVRTRMNNARAEELWVTAQSLKDAGQNEEALKLALQILQLNPNQAGALAFVKAQNQAQMLAKYIKAGDDAMGKEQWDASIISYKQALALIDAKDDATRKRIEEQITEAQYRAAMVRAREALAQDDFPKARQYASEAKGAKDTPEVNDLLAQIDRREKYKQNLDLGKSLLSRGDYLKALSALEAAQKIDKTTEVQEAIKECQYRRYLAKGKVAMDNKQYAEAAGYYATAASYRSTPEILARWAEARQLAAKQKPTPEGGGP